MVFFVVVFAILGVYSQTYFITSTGSDSAACGAQNTPCASINQVLINYPNASYNVSIGAGIYSTTAITLGDAFVVFRGTGNPIITPSWRSDSFITNTATSSFEFHDLSITLSDAGDAFTTLDYTTNSVVFENVVLTYSKATSSNFVSQNGGSVVFRNVSINNANFVSYYFIVDFTRDDSNITITGSTFDNLTLDEESGFLVFRANGVANIIINSSTFTSIIAGYTFIGLWAEDTNQLVSITNNVFSNFNSYLPSVYYENDGQAAIYVSDTTWINCTSRFVSGALETLGSNDGNDHNITLNNLVFVNCGGPLAGAILVAFNSLNVSGSSFSGNSGQYGNDLVQGLEANSSQFGYNITNSFSSSALPKAVIQNLANGTITDISDQLPDPRAELVPIHLLTRKDMSAAPKFGRKPKKH